MNSQMNNNQIIKAENIDLKALIEKDASLSINFKSQILDTLNENFTKDEQQWYIANLYIYLNYHPTTDFPINLENVYKLVGFTTKANAKRTLLNNFVADEDYKTLLIPKDEQKKDDNRGGHNEETVIRKDDRTNQDNIYPIHKDEREGVFIPKDENLKLGGRPDERAVIRKDDGKFANETIMLNTNTFKGLCMLVKTEKAKQIRKYYIKLETIFNKIVNEERIEYERKVKECEQLLIEQKLLLQNQIDKNKVDKLLERESTLIEMYRKQNVFYICLFCYEEKWYVKFGISEGAVNIKGDVSHRINSHKNEISKELYLVHIIKTDKCKELENKFKLNYAIPLIEKTFTNGENKTEIIELNDKITIEHVIKIANKLSKEPENEPEITDEERKLKLQLQLKQEETKQMEIQLELEKLKIQNQNLGHQQNNQQNNQQDNQVNQNQQDNQNEIEVKPKNLKFLNMDKCLEFMEAKTIYDKNNTSKISLSDLYTRFVIWLNEKYNNTEIPTKISFSRIISTKYHFLNKTNINGTSGMRGVIYRKWIPA